MAMITTTHQDQPVRHLWRDRPWLDLPIAVILGIVMINLHVSTAGDALSALERGDRRGFYALLSILAVVLLASTLRRDDPTGRWSRGCLGFAAASGMAGILLDVQDGPVATVQLVVLVGFFLAAAATVRLILGFDGPATSPRSSD
ncbi:MAG: hypothetical protein QOG82_1711 [Actinomycetota bacterium]|jgi:hypothetical protein|nr:hypothetical protein [Actinomycetota bacterium]